MTSGFTFTDLTSFVVVTFLKDFSVNSGSVVVPNTPGVEVDFLSFINNTGILTMRISTDWPSLRMVYAVGVEAVVFQTTKQYDYSAVYISNRIMTYKTNSLASYGPDFGVSSLIYGPTYDRNCSVGIYHFFISGMSGLGEVRSSFFTIENNSTGFSSISQVYDAADIYFYVYFNLFCLVECTSTAFYNVVSNDCQVCSIANCSKCQTTTFCKDCVNDTLGVSSSGGC